MIENEEIGASGGSVIISVGSVLLCRSLVYVHMCNMKG